MVRSSSGLRENVAAGFICLFGVWSILFLYLEKDSKLVRFYIMQNLFLFLAIWVGTLLCVLPGIFMAVVWIIEIVNAFRGKKMVIPVIGEWSERLLS